MHLPDISEIRKHLGMDGEPGARRFAPIPQNRHGRRLEQRLERKKSKAKRAVPV